MILKHTASHMKTVSYAMLKRSTIPINGRAIYIEHLSAGEGRGPMGLWRDNLQWAATSTRGSQSPGGDGRDGCREEEHPPGFRV